MKKTTKILFAFILILAMGCGITVYAVDWTAELKNFLQSEKAYYSCSIENLGRLLKLNKDAFKGSYDDKYVVVTGDIQNHSVASNRKQVELYEYGVKAVIDTSDKKLNSKVGSIHVGDTVTVYGQIKLKGWSNDSYEIVADYIDINAVNDFDRGEYIYYGANAVECETYSNLAADGHISFSVPKAWKDEYVMSPLTNNNVNGYQFALNALYPQNVNFPEIFYIFYFDYNFYLDTPPTKPSKGDRQDIEKLIIKNILGNISGDFDIKVDDFKASSEKEYDYYVTTYHPASMKDYRLEFIFQPDDNRGLVCMLYLYFPKTGEFSHVRDVAYVVETLN